jgi:hypothetical protein
MTPTEVRQSLIANGYVPVPCDGKDAKSEQWERRTLETAQTALTMWARDFPGATNTGILCVTTPTLDLDLLDNEAVDAAIALVQERFADRGKIMLRYGRRPKVAIPFQTDTPFKKIRAELIAPNGTEQKIEFLAMGQQVVVHGIHPDTHEPYQWSDGNPGKVKRSELPPITADEAKTLVSDITALIEPFGYQRVGKAGKSKGKPSPKGNGHDTAADALDTSGGEGWGYLQDNILKGCSLHDSIRDLAAKLIASGMGGGAAVNMLRGLMEQSEAPRNERWQARYDDIPRAVSSAERLPRENEEREPTPPLGEDSPEPEPDPASVVDGAAVLDDVHEYLTRFVSYPSEHASIGHALWCGHTHLLQAFESTGRIAFLSAEPESGKTRALEASEPLVCRPISTVNASASYLFRKCGDEDGPPTVLFDEIDTIFGPKAKEHEDIRGFINAGHRRGATYGRCVVRGSIVSTEETPVYAAVAMAGLGWLPDTLLSRSIIIRMRRRLRSERVEPFRQRIHVPEGREIGRRLATWAKTVIKLAEEMRPTMPEGVEDRQADAWEPLLAVADLAGGQWPKRAREAAKALVAVARETPVSLHLRLLEDLRIVFWRNLRDVAKATPKGLPTKKILEGLYVLDDAPWHVINKGEAFSSSQLATNLHGYSVYPGILRPHPTDHSIKARGYLLGELADAWRRYLKPLSLPQNDVAGVAREAREVLDKFFEWASEPDDTVATAATPNSGTERGLEREALDPARVRQLAGWWRKQAKVLQAEMSPATLQAHLEQRLRETLANELPDDAIDLEVRRIVRAANKPTPKPHRKTEGA